MKYFAFIALLLLAPFSAFAQNSYQLLEPLPGLSSGAGVSFAQLLGVFFTAALSLSAAAAVVMITLGGIQYMFSDAVGAKSAGRERIKNAVYGLILVFASWLIINTISPNLLLFNLNIGNTGGRTSVCPYWTCPVAVDRTVRDSNQANKDVQTATGAPGSFKASMVVEDERMGTNGQPSSERGKNYVRECIAIKGKPVAESKNTYLGTYTLKCEMP